MGTIIRLNPYQVWEVDAVEGWLDDMATQGYLLEGRKGGYFLFQETEPQKVRHRIDVRNDAVELNTDETLLRQTPEKAQRTLKHTHAGAGG